MRNDMSFATIVRELAPSVVAGVGAFCVSLLFAGSVDFFSVAHAAIIGAVIFLIVACPAIFLLPGALRQRRQERRAAAKRKFLSRRHWRKRRHAHYHKRNAQRAIPAPNWPARRRERVK